MRLVECMGGEFHQEQAPNICAPNIKDAEYSAPHALQNLDIEMGLILNDASTDIDQKWLLYHQALQRYLRFIKRMRYDESLLPAVSEKDPSACEPFNTVLRTREPPRFSSFRNITRHTSTPKKMSVPALNLPAPNRELTPIPKFPERSVRKRGATKNLFIRQRRMRPQNKTPSALHAITVSSGSPLSSPNSDADDDDDDEIFEDVCSQPSDDDGAPTMKILTKPPGVDVNGWSKSNIKK